MKNQSTSAELLKDGGMSSENKGISAGEVSKETGWRFGGLKQAVGGIAGNAAMVETNAGKQGSGCIWRVEETLWPDVYPRSKYLARCPVGHTVMAGLRRARVRAQSLERCSALYHPDSWNPAFLADAYFVLCRFWGRGFGSSFYYRGGQIGTKDWAFWRV